MQCLAHQTRNRINYHCQLNSGHDGEHVYTADPISFEFDGQFAAITPQDVDKMLAIVNEDPSEQYTTDQVKAAMWRVLDDELYKVVESLAYLCGKSPHFERYLGKPTSQVKEQ